MSKEKLIEKLVILVFLLSDLCLVYFLIQSEGLYNIGVFLSIIGGLGLIGFLAFSGISSTIKGFRASTREVTILQIVILWVAIFVIVFTGIDPPTSRGRIDLPRLIIIWFMVALVTSALIFTLDRLKKKTKQKGQ
jgi:hypothetical protein